METFGQIFWGFCKKNVGLGAFLIATLLIGTFGYATLSKGQYSLLDCLYMTVITITTIGYGEIVDLSHNPAGRIFTIFIAFSGIGIATYLFSNVTALMVEGQLKEIFRRKRMEKEIGKLKGHYIICSAEDVGFYVANELHITQRPCVVIDIDKTKIERVLKAFPELLFVEGDATDGDTLLKSGIQDAAGLFAVTADDNQNLVISLTARQTNPKIRIIAKCNDVKNSDKIRKAGADAVVSPSYIGGLRIASEMIRPTAVSFIDVMLRDREKNLRIEEIVVPPLFEGRPLRALNLQAFPSMLLLAIKTNGDWVYNPPRGRVLNRGNTLIVMVTTEDRLRIESLFEPLNPA